MIVIDTHVLVWFVQGDLKMGEAAKRAVAHELATGAVLVPAITIWEIALLNSRGRLALGMDVRQWTRGLLNTPGYTLAPMDADIALRSIGLEWSHKDPADRMIVATALQWDAPLLTADRIIAAYAKAGHVEIIDASE